MEFISNVELYVWKWFWLTRSSILPEAWARNAVPRNSNYSTRRVEDLDLDLTEYKSNVWKLLCWAVTNLCF